MNLYRATWQRADGSLRHCTFAARDAESAHATAAKWSIGDKLLTVRLDRALQAPLLTLTA
jgi:hypothetical protein